MDNTVIIIVLLLILFMNNNKPKECFSERMSYDDHCKNIIETKKKIEIDDDKKVEMKFSDNEEQNLKDCVGCIKDSTYAANFNSSQENSELDRETRIKLSRDKQKVCRKLRTGYWR